MTHSPKCAIQKELSGQPRECDCGAERPEQHVALQRMRHDHVWTTDGTVERCRCGASKTKLAFCPQCGRPTDALYSLLGRRWRYMGCQDCYQHEVDRLYTLANAAQKPSLQQHERVPLAHEQEDLATHAQADAETAGDTNA